MRKKNYQVPFSEFEKMHSMTLSTADKETLVKYTENDLMDECYGFYHVFLQLADKCFLKADINVIGYDEYRNNDSFFAACMVNGAFASELALKYLLFSSQRTFPETHDLKELFDMLPDKHKTPILNSLNNMPRIGKGTIEDEINLISEAFENWRYNFDIVADHNADIFFKSFVCAVCRYVLSLKEE